jgi:hypothetical protein
MRRKLIDALVTMLFNCADTIGGYALAFGRANGVDLGSAGSVSSAYDVARAHLHDENLTDAQRPAGCLGFTWLLLFPTRPTAGRRTPANPFQAHAR